MRKVVFKELERALLGFNQKYFRARHVVLIERACLGPISSTTKIKQKCFKQIAVPAEGCSVSAFSGDLLRSDSEQESLP